jgi:hypothetical protein
MMMRKKRMQWTAQVEKMDNKDYRLQILGKKKCCKTWKKMFGTAVRLWTGSRFLKPWQQNNEYTSTVQTQPAHAEHCNLATFKRATLLPTPRRPHWFAGRHYNTLSLDVAVHGGFGRWSTSRLGASLSTVTQISSMRLPVIAGSCSHNTKHRHKKPNSALPNTTDSDRGLSRLRNGRQATSFIIKQTYLSLLIWRRVAYCRQSDTHTSQTFRFITPNTWLKTRIRGYSL